MSLIIGNNMCITYNETDVKCPICTFEFDAGKKTEKAKYPTFKTKCPACKGAIGISVPIFGGNTRCFEWDVPKETQHLRQENITPNRINGKIVIEKPFDDNSDESSDILV